MRETRGAATRFLRPLCSITFALFLFSARSTSAITAQLIASGFSQPLFVAAPPGDTSSIYVVEQTGKIWRVDLSDNTVDSTPFFDVSSRIVSGGEQGLLGFAFDPDYTTNHKFYVNFVVPGGAFGNGTTHISQYEASSSTVAKMSQAQRAKKKKKKHRRHHPPPHPTPTPGPGGEILLLQFDHPETNHNGGWIGFSGRAGDDHNLYIATGDGGSGDDQGPGHIEPGGNAQNLRTLLGKMLRIHVNPTTGNFSIPSNNPLAASMNARREIFNYGLRNPFRNSFDRQTGDLYIGDVGQGAREEVDVQSASNPGGGENYGWRLREGTIPTPGGVGGGRPAGNVDPILDYDHSVGQTIIGGYVYRGTQVTTLAGKYVFGDYAAGKIFTCDPNGSNFTDITAQLFPTRTGSIALSNPSSFGEDASGELYITDIGAGRVFKIIP
jgi:glucose/arabinose dehydrogenase